MHVRALRSTHQGASTVHLKHLRHTLIALLLTTQIGLSQTIPVVCRRPDTPVGRPPSPRANPQDAETIDSTGRATPGMFSIPEPVNFGITQMHIADYADCVDPTACYWSDLAKQTALAQAKLQELIDKHRSEKNLAIVLDIDETSLSSYCEEKREGFGYFDSAYQSWIVSSEASVPIPGTLALFNQARQANIEVFFITGRNHEQYDTTARNLKAAGYSGWNKLILRDESERSMTATKYKSQERDKIVADKYHILLNVGDQWSDLNGTSKAEVSVKLPNPFYYLP